MADVKMPKSIPCLFDKDGWHPCKKPSDNGWCSEHEDLKCVSCGNRAVKSCDYQMGGLGCGRPLCEECTHGENGKHLPKEESEKLREIRRKREEELQSSTPKSEQILHHKFTVPANLFELLKRDLEEQGYELVHIYYLTLKNSCMGFYPAVFSSDSKRIVITDSLHLLERVWKNLPPESATLHKAFGYLNSKKNIVFIVTVNVSEHKDRAPIKILSETEFDELKLIDRAFEWCPGLISFRSISKEDYLLDLNEQAQAMDPAFKPS